MVSDLFPLISIIIPTLNEEKTIEQCIQSIQESRYPLHRIEIIIVDGGSVDNTVELLSILEKKYDNLKYMVCNGYNIPEARNKAIDISSGEFILNFSGHAQLQRDTIKTLVSKFKSVNRVDSVGCRLDTSNKDFFGGLLGKLFKGFMAGSTTGIFNQNLNHKGDCFVVHLPFVMYKRKVFECVGLFDPVFDCGEDAEFNLRCKKEGLSLLYTDDTSILHEKPKDIKSLFFQMVRYGSARTMILRKHRKDTSQFLLWMPVVFMVFLCFSLLAGFFGSLLLIYVLACMLSSFFTCCGFYGIGYWVLYPVIHIGYMLGIVNGIFGGKQ